ncbi:MAG TPA: hypothetical protein PKI46_05795, partial [Bacteroidales bacterium]|nr:hypothetical protein [Bacteroidales bacterium]
KSNNSTIDNTTSNSYLKLDLTNKQPNETINISINATVSSESNYDLGYATIKSTASIPAYSDTAGRFMYISGNVSGNYSTNLNGGQIYYLHIGYRKDANNSLGEDCLIINSIKYDNIDIEYNYEGNVKYNSTFIENNGIVNIISGNFIGKRSGSTNIYYQNFINNGTLNILGGKICGNAFSYIIINRVNANLNITGGTIDYQGRQNSMCIYNESLNDTNISNCTIIGDYILRNEAAGKVDIDNAKITWIPQYNQSIRNQSTGIINIKNSEFFQYGSGYGRNYIYNYSAGIINIEASTLNMGASIDITNDNLNGTINIKDSTLNSNYSYSTSSGACIVSYGKINIDNSTINKNGFSAGAIVQYSSSVTTMVSGVINATGSIGINVQSGTLVIGEKGGIPSKTIPIINSNTNGLYVSTTGIAKFYDGLIKGQITKSIIGNILEIEETYEIIKTNDGTIESAFLDKEPMAKLVSSNQDFDSIQEAIDAAAENTQETIQITRNIILTTVSPSVNIPSNKNIVLDLNGYEIKTSNLDTFVNEGIFEIISTERIENSVIVAEAGVGLIRNYTENIIYNKPNSEFILRSGNLEMNGTGNSSVFKSIIRNGGDVYLEGGKITSTSTHINC